MSSRLRLIEKYGRGATATEAGGSEPLVKTESALFYALGRLVSNVTSAGQSFYRHHDWNGSEQRLIRLAQMKPDVGIGERARYIEKCTVTETVTTEVTEDIMENGLPLTKRTTTTVVEETFEAMTPDILAASLDSRLSAREK